MYQMGFPELSSELKEKIALRYIEKSLDPTVIKANIWKEIVIEENGKWIRHLSTHYRNQCCARIEYYSEYDINKI